MISFLQRRITFVLSFGLIVALTLTNTRADTSDFASSGELRVGLYSGSPSSVIVNATNSQKVGVGYELGAALAKVLDVKYVPIIFPKNADVFAAAKNSTVDLVFTNATPERSQVLQFSKPVVRIERGYLVNSQGAIHSVGDLDQPGVKVGVSVGSSSELELTKILKSASVVRTNSTAEAVDMLKKGQLDAFSTNKGILFEMSDQWAQGKVLDEVTGYESIALGVPKTKTVDMQVINNFVDDLKVRGALNQMVQRAGLRGVAKD